MVTNYTNVTTLPETIFNDVELPGLITRETRLIINDVISCGFQPVISAVGLAGNVVSLSVLAYQGVGEVTNIVLLALTLVDLLYLVLWYGPIAECIVRRFDVVTAINLEVEYKARPIMVASRLGTVSRLLTCLIAVERYIAVLHPLHAPALLTRRRIATACLVLLVLPFALSFHVFALFDIGKAYSPRYNATIKFVKFSAFTVENLDAVVLYNDLVLAVLFSYVPMAVITYCTAAILLALRKSRRHRQEMTAGGEGGKRKTSVEQRQVTKILISICLVFVVCTLPSVVVQVARLLFARDGFSDVGRYRNLSFATITITLLFSLINSSVNFFFYVAYSNKFKATARKLFLCWRRSDLSRSRSEVTVSTVTGTSQVTETAFSD